MQGAYRKATQHEGEERIVAIAGGQREGGFRARFRGPQGLDSDGLRTVYSAFKSRVRRAQRQDRG